MIVKEKDVRPVSFSTMVEKADLYFDYNSTTPTDDRVIEELIPFLKVAYANASSTHAFGQRIQKRVNQAREQVAEFIGAESQEITFTSGATEAINIALKGVAESYSSKGNHIITVSTEHKAVLDTCKDLGKRGIDVSYLPVQSDGLVDLGELESFIRPDTILVSVMYVNNETGIIQPIKQIASMAHKNGALFMTDATQAAGKIEIDVDDLGVDLLCFSGHKMYAPKGIGALYIRQRGNKVKLAPQIHGGGHEQGLRSGTLNVPGIIALAKACELGNQEMVQNRSFILQLRDSLETELLQLPGTFVNGGQGPRIHNTSNICFKGQDASVLIGRMKDIAVSNGAACSSAVLEPSHVLMAMGLNEDEAFGSLRFSFGKFNSIEEVRTAVQKLKELIQQDF